MKNQNSQAQKYADTNALNEWSKDLNKINEEAHQILSKFSNEVTALEDCWKGNAADGFIKSCNDVIDIGKKYHNGMRDTDTFLVTVANHMEER